MTAGGAPGICRGPDRDALTRTLPETGGRTWEATGEGDARLRRRARRVGRGRRGAARARPDRPGLRRGGCRACGRRRPGRRRLCLESLRQRPCQIAGAHEAGGGVPSQAAGEHAVQGRRERRVEHRRPRQRLAAQVPGDRVVAAAVRLLPGRRLEEDEREGVVVRAAVHLTVAVAQLLRRHVGRGSERDSGLGHPDVVRRASDPEVPQQSLAVGHREQDVLRLDVPVHDAVRVGDVQRFGDLTAQSQQFGARERATPLTEVLGQRAGGRDEVHHDAQQAALVEHVVDRHDVRVAELGRGPRLAQESLPLHLVGADRAVEDLERTVQIEVVVVHAVDAPETSDAETLDDGIGADLGSDQDIVIHGGNGGPTRAA